MSALSSIAPDQQSPQAHTDTVLVVDDTPESLRFLADTLEAEGMRVLIATSGEAALALLAHITPDLILMDAVMPGMGGFEATRILKQLPASAHVPVIFMTGLTESEHVLAALEAGSVDYVRKPLVINELVARVRVHMANARLAQDSQAALDASGRHLIAVTRGESIEWWTPQAGSLLEDYFPAWRRISGPAPDALAPALARLARAEENGATIRLDLPHATLELVLVTRLRGAEMLVRINDVNPAADIALLQARHGLTLREAEVLLWISHGKPNRVISEILDISPRTVNKHLEQVFIKLGVETRAAAAAFAVRALQS
jgi:DNA-binding NarL/FixJ family response regulator